MGLARARLGRSDAVRTVLMSDMDVYVRVSWRHAVVVPPCATPVPPVKWHKVPSYSWAERVVPPVPPIFKILVERLSSDRD